MVCICNFFFFALAVFVIVRVAEVPMCNYQERGCLFVKNPNE